MPKSRPPHPVEFRQRIIEPVLASKTSAQLSRVFESACSEPGRAWASRRVYASSGTSPLARDPRPLETLVLLGDAFASQIHDQDSEENSTAAAHRADLLRAPHYKRRRRRAQYEDPDSQKKQPADSAATRTSTPPSSSSVEDYGFVPLPMEIPVEPGRTHRAHLRTRYNQPNEQRTASIAPVARCAAAPVYLRPPLQGATCS